MRAACNLYFFFFNDTATTEIYTLSLHDALPICFLLVREEERRPCSDVPEREPPPALFPRFDEPQEPFLWRHCPERSEEHTSELQSQSNLVCRLLLDKKK